MRRSIVMLAVVFAVCSTGNAEVGVSVNINVNSPAQAPEGYVATCADDDMFREDLFVINTTCVGFWVVLPTGGRVLHCRNMWYDRKGRDWYYGPWHEDRTVTYISYRRCPYYNVRFHDYMHRGYPRYYERRFHHEMMVREKRHEKFEDRNRTFDREKQGDQERNAPGDYGQGRKDDRDKTFGREKQGDQGRENHGNHGHDRGHR